jgi:hypothetical protein
MQVVYYGSYRKEALFTRMNFVSAFLNPSKSLYLICIPLVCETLLRCKYRFSSIVLRSIPVVVIRCEENEIYQLDSRIETDNIRCFILLSGLRNSSHLRNICSCL